MSLKKSKNVIHTQKRNSYAINTFKQDKSYFVSCVFICATIWFLAVCVLFCIYICRSFDNSSITSTQIQGDYSKQGVANGSVSIY